MDVACRRHDMPDHVRALLAPNLPGRPGVWGSLARDNRQFIQGSLNDSLLRRLISQKRPAAYILRQAPQRIVHRLAT